MTRQSSTNCDGRANARYAMGLVALVVSGIAAAQAADTVAIRAGHVLAADGSWISGGVVLIADGTVQVVAPDAEIPGDASTIDASERYVTPGLVDAACVVDSRIAQIARDQRRFADDCLQCSQLRLSLTAARPGGMSPGADASAVMAAAHAEHTCARHREHPELAEQCVWCQLAWKRQQAAHSAANPADCTCVLCDPRKSGAPQSVGVGSRTTWADQSSEVIPHESILDAVNLLSDDFEQLCQSGVTSVYLAPDSASVIGARGAVVKTGGPLRQRIVERESAVRAAMGADPSMKGLPNRLPFGGMAILQTRRPNTRMGVFWVFRKAFYDAQRAARGLALHGADQPPVAAIPVLNAILAGKVPLRIQARKQHDILAALELAREFGLRVAIDEATEAYQCLPQLKAAEAPVVYGPLFFEPRGFRRFVNETDEARWSTPARLETEGIPFALTAQEMRDEEGLIRQAMVARRYGLAEDAALAAVTARPAALLRLEGRIGALQAGADADLVVWSGDPLAATSRVELVMINGKVVYEAN